MIRILFLLPVLYYEVNAMVLDSNTIRITGEGGLNLAKGTRCQVDSDCQSGNFCHKTSDKEPLCKTCHALRRRCQRDAMCCPGTLCINDVCARPEEVVTVRSITTGQDVSASKGKNRQRILENKPKKQSSSKGQEGDNCLRTSDCAPGLCCARHFWDKICKRMPKEGEVCSKRGRKEVPQSHELFQRCECSPGLSCRLQSDNKDKQNSRLRVCLRPLEGSTKKEAGSSSKKLKRKRRH
ncbi:dickkopf-related protein 4-like [Polypterus senegalus]